MWQPIKSAPLGEPILLYFPKQMRSWDTSDVKLEPRVVTGMRDRPIDCWHEVESLQEIEGQPSHWMPLPDAPLRSTSFGLQPVLSPRAIDFGSEDDAADH